MTIFALKPSLTPRRNFNAIAFDDENGLWNDERLSKSDPLISTWNSPRLVLYPRGSHATDLLFHPCAMAVADRVREKLAGLEGAELLPVQIEDKGEFYIIHVTVAVEPSPDIVVRRPGGPNENIIEIFEFLEDYKAPGPIFRVRQPADSPAGRLGYCVGPIYTTEAGANVAVAACGAHFLRAVPVKQGVW